MATAGACTIPTANPAAVQRPPLDRLQLQFRGWQRGPMMQPGRFTELFFLDEATAFAAGHRPCALCRREDYSRFGEMWRGDHPGQVGADAIDAQLQLERIDPVTQSQRRYCDSWSRYPTGRLCCARGGRIWCGAIG